MAVKTYRAKSIQEALACVKRELGPHALILSSRRLPKSPRDPYSDEQFEIKAVPGEPEPERDRPAREADPGPAPEQETCAPLFTDAGDGDDGADPLGDIRSTLVSIRQMVALLSAEGGMPDALVLNPELARLYVRLVGAGVSRTRAEMFLKKTAAAPDGPPRDLASAARRTVNAIQRAFTVGDPFREVSKKPVVAAFVGPTGVGKTTTVAKLAAELHLRKQRRVGVISIDGYRIGAVEQLKTYCAIMGVPFMPAYTAEELEKALERMKRADVVLIDTSGQSPYDAKRIRSLLRVLNGKRQVQAHLVLSVTTRREDLKAATEAFSDFSPKSCIFTKVDETSRPGGLIDHVLDAGLPVSYISNGQRVPEDLMRATKNAIMKMAFAGGGAGRMAAAAA